MPKNSRTKGKVGELEACRLIREHGFEARRGQQFSGGGDSPDVVHNIPGVHIEVKRTESFMLYQALDQAVADAKSKNLDPVVLHRRNNREWVVVMPASNFLNIMRSGFDPGPSIGPVPKDEL